MLHDALLILQIDPPHQARDEQWTRRTFAPCRAMAECPSVYVINVDHVHRFGAQLMARADVVVVSAGCDPDLLPVIADRAQGRSVTVYELHENLSSLDPSHPSYGFFRRPENVRLFKRMANACGAIQYSDADLYRVYGYLNRNNRVFSPRDAVGALSSEERPTDGDTDRARRDLTDTRERIAFYRALLEGMGHRPRSSAETETFFADVSSWEGAEVVGRHALLSDSRFESMLREGQARANKGPDREQGAQILRGASRLFPEHYLPYFYVGERLGTEDDYSEALAKNPKSIASLLALGQLSLANGEPKRALERFVAAADVFASYELPYLYAARALMRLGNSADARQFEAIAAQMIAGIEPRPR